MQSFSIFGDTMIANLVTPKHTPDISKGMFDFYLSAGLQRLGLLGIATYAKRTLLTRANCHKLIHATSFVFFIFMCFIAIAIGTMESSDIILYRSVTKIEHNTKRILLIMDDL